MKKGKSMKKYLVVQTPMHYQGLTQEEWDAMSPEEQAACKVLHRDVPEDKVNQILTGLLGEALDSVYGKHGLR